MHCNVSTFNQNQSPELQVVAHILWFIWIESVLSRFCEINVQCSFPLLHTFTSDPQNTKVIWGLNLLSIWKLLVMECPVNINLGVNNATDHFRTHLKTHDQLSYYLYFYLFDLFLAVSICFYLCYLQIWNYQSLTYPLTDRVTTRICDRI